MFLFNGSCFSFQQFIFGSGKPSRERRQQRNKTFGKGPTHFCWERRHISFQEVKHFASKNTVHFYVFCWVLCSGGCEVVPMFLFVAMVEFSTLSASTKKMVIPQANLAKKVPAGLMPLWIPSPKLTAHPWKWAIPKGNNHLPTIQPSIFRCVCC